MNDENMIFDESLSARRAWIEIRVEHQWADRNGSLSARRAWIEISGSTKPNERRASLSARRAWIEMVLWYVYWSYL